MHLRFEKVGYLTAKIRYCVKFARIFWFTYTLDDLSLHLQLQFHPLHSLWTAQYILFNFLLPLLFNTHIVNGLPYVGLKALSQAVIFMKEGVLLIVLEQVWNVVKLHSCPSHSASFLVSIQCLRNVKFEMPHLLSIMGHLQHRENTDFTVTAVSSEIAVPSKLKELCDCLLFWYRTMEARILHRLHSPLWHCSVQILFTTTIPWEFKKQYLTLLCYPDACLLFTGLIWREREREGDHLFLLIF